MLYVCMFLFRYLTTTITSNNVDSYTSNVLPEEIVRTIITLATYVETH